MESRKIFFSATFILTLVSGMAFLADAATMDLVVTVGGKPYGGEVLDIGTVVTVEVVQSAQDVLHGGGKLAVDFVGANPTITDTTPQCPFMPGPVVGDGFCWSWLLSIGVAMVGDAAGYTAWKGAGANIGIGTPGLGCMCLCQYLPLMTFYVSTYEFSFETTETTTLSWGPETDWHKTGGNIELGPEVVVYVSPCSCYGDANGSGNVNVSDLAVIVGVLSKYTSEPRYTIYWPFPPEVGDCWDVNGDGAVDVADLAAIVGFLGGYPDTIPPYSPPAGECLPAP